MESNPDPKPTPAPRLVIVIWEDTAGLDDTWNDRQEAEELKPGTMSSVGWIIKDEPHYLTLTSSAEFDVWIDDNPWMVHIDIKDLEKHGIEP